MVPKQTVVNKEIVVKGSLKDKALKMAQIKNNQKAE